MAKRSKSWSKWTPEMLKKFEFDYPYLEWEELLRDYPFSKSSLLSKASELGIRRRTGRMIKYTVAEDNTITECFNRGMTDEETGKILNRSAAGIECRRIRLGILHRPGEWSHQEEEILRAYYGNTPAADVADMLPERSRNAVVAHAAVLGISGYRDYHEYTHDEECFISENYLSMSDSEIGDILGHPRESIKNRRNKMGLHRPKDISKYGDAAEYFRKYNQAWKSESMQACRYKCLVTGERFDDIHHLMSLNKIIGDACLSAGINLDTFDPNYATTEEKQRFVRIVKEEQAKYPLGVCLDKEVHMQFYNIYGYGDNTPDQFYEFISNHYPNTVISQ